MPSLTGLDTILKYIKQKSPLLGARAEAIEGLFLRSSESLAIDDGKLDQLIATFDLSIVPHPDSGGAAFKSFLRGLKNNADGVHKLTAQNFGDRVEGVVSAIDYHNPKRLKSAPFSFVNSYGFPRADIKDETELTR